MPSELVRELSSELPAGWRWRPEWVEDGEAAGLLNRKNLPEDATARIRNDAVEVLGRCRPTTAPDGQETGLVVGYVQSGKTLSFTTVAALAADNGYPIIIVLSGTKRALTEQTVKRLRSDLAVEEPRSRWNLIEGQTSNPQLAQQLSQHLALWDQADPYFPAKVALIILLKNASRLRALAQAFRHVNLSGRPCLIIDDEADEHGLNTRVQQGDMSATYRCIVELRRTVPSHTYLQYTATPQANVLISVLDTLSPSFGWVLTPGAGYAGGTSFFGGNQDLVSTIPNDDLAVTVQDASTDNPPPSLLHAMRLFFIGVAAQACNRRAGFPTESLRSMLVHPSMQQLDHLRFATWIGRVKQRWVALFAGQGDPDDRAHEIGLFRIAWEELRSSIESRPGNEQIPPFEEIEPRLHGAFNATPPAWEVNSREAVARWDHSNWSRSSSHILVGGENLGRGFTVEGLTITYMPRGSGQRQVDTIEQRARFFGYKGRYLGFCRAFLDPDVSDIYTEYLDHEDFLIEKLRELAGQPGASMTDWRRAMILASSVRPTRPNVLPRGLYRQLQVSEWTAHSFPLSLETEYSQANRAVLGQFLRGLHFEDDEGDSRRTVEQIHGVAREIPLNKVLDGLLVPFAHPSGDAIQFSGLQLVLGYYLSGHPNATATVYRMSYRAQKYPGGGTRYRSPDDGGRINPFQGSNLPAYPGDQLIHGGDVTVQIHDVDIRHSRKELQRGNVPVLAVWLPTPVRQGILLENQND